MRSSLGRPRSGLSQIVEQPGSFLGKQFLQLRCDVLAERRVRHGKRHRLLHSPTEAMRQTRNG